VAVAFGDEGLESDDRMMITMKEIKKTGRRQVRKTMRKSRRKRRNK
jgi:hypothetical protein